ncbi:MAG TPA: hypothetical protein VIJ77_06555 [Candidatus Tumulicola sp.]
MLRARKDYALGRTRVPLERSHRRDPSVRYRTALGARDGALRRVPFARSHTGSVRGTRGSNRGSRSTFRPTCSAASRAPCRLIDELRATSEEFAELWSQHDGLGSVDGLKRYLHPQLGEPILDYTAFALPGDGDMHVIVLTAAPGSETEAKLKLLSPAAV